MWNTSSLGSRRAVLAHGRAQVARRKAGELHAEILARPDLERVGERDDDLDDVGRERRHAGDDAGALGDDAARPRSAIVALPITFAWQASTVPFSAVPRSSTWPLTTVTRQVSHCPEQQSCGMATQPLSPASTSVSP